MRKCEASDPLPQALSATRSTGSAPSPHFTRRLNRAATVTWRRLCTKQSTAIIGVQKRRGFCVNCRDAAASVHSRTHLFGGVLVRNWLCSMENSPTILDDSRPVPNLGVVSVWQLLRLPISHGDWRTVSTYVARAYCRYRGLLLLLGVLAFRPGDNTSRYALPVSTRDMA